MATRWKNTKEIKFPKGIDAYRSPVLTVSGEKHDKHRSPSTSKTQYSVHQRIETMIKIYPDRVRFYKYTEPDYIRRYDLDPHNPNKKKKPKSIIEIPEEDYSGINRAKNEVLDLALCNTFDLMTTHTLDPKKIDRYDDEAVISYFSGWRNHQRATYGKFDYIVIPERHKDGALHFHGLFGNYQGKLKDSGKYEKGRPVFNLASYRMGWTTAVKIDSEEESRAKATGYVTKYITKDMPKVVKKGKQRYWCSSGLKRPLRIINPLGNSLQNYGFVSAHKTSAYEMFEYRGVMSEEDILLMADYGRRRYDDLEVWKS